jgi:hypothetical protein
LLAAALPLAVAALPGLLDLFCRVYCQSGDRYQATPTGVVYEMTTS